ncbi:HNH endonuclease [Paenibacillus sp. HN-1]|uniref:HNH endonuclease n=1 Tax=Paenibacillus TaxID=44249 RepID=UPI001CA7E7D6|nr:MULTISPECIES: HNH endonuclease [Paenibacillus]MBY9077165.1 HNH endonuclease [Paenibacillus sp. CGMCC 1.18879]MBY9084439.1 HNH endonuclease [Paenibacillus sinensis]
MKNQYEIRGAVTVILVDSPKYGMKEVLIDTADLPLAKEFPNSWCVGWDPTSREFYCRGKIQQPDGKRITIYLHRWITVCPDDMQIDHFDNNPLNNRRKNLRILNNSENQQNLRGARRNSKSGVLGVSWSRSDNKWMARIEVNGKKYFCGLFADISDASKAVKKARAELMPYSKEATALTKRA